MLATIIATVLVTIVVPKFDSNLLMPKIAVENCNYLKTASSKTKNSALKIANILYQAEEEMNIPDSMRGMILAAACLESAFNPNAKGDRKFSKSKKVPKAIGVLQMWRWYEKSYGTDRRNPRSSALGWLRHIKRMVPKVKRQCRHKTTRKVWVAAWVTGIRYPKPGGRCFERPKHYRYFLKIRRLYEVKTNKSLRNLGK